MRIGSMNYPGKPVTDEIKLFDKFGFDFIDLTIEPPEATPEKISKQKEKILDLISTHDFGLVGHMPWFLEISHPYERVRNAVVKVGKRVLDVSADLGIKKVTTHVEANPSIWLEGYREKFIQTQIKSIGELVKYGNSLGIVVCAENWIERCMNIDEFKLLFRKVPDAKFNLDVGHAALYGGKEDRIVEYLNTFKTRLVHIHVHDNKAGTEDLHLPIGAGVIDWERVIKAIKDVGYNDTITLEIHSRDRSYLKISKEKLLELWKGIK